MQCFASNVIHNHSVFSLFEGRHAVGRVDRQGDHFGFAVLTVLVVAVVTAVVFEALATDVAVVERHVVVGG